jgi:hypothetical protein
MVDLQSPLSALCTVDPPVESATITVTVADSSPALTLAKRPVLVPRA